MSSLKKSRQYRRAIGRSHNESALKLQGNIEKFFEDCIGKSDDEVRELFSWYDKKWREYAAFKNSVTKSFSVFEDAFTETMENLHKTIRKVDPNTVDFDMVTALHVCDLYRRKTRAERFFEWLEKKLGRKKPIPIRPLSRPSETIPPAVEEDVPANPNMTVVK